MSIPAIEVVEIRADAAAGSKNGDVSQTESGNSATTDIFAAPSDGGYLDEGATGAVAGEQDSWAVAQEEPESAQNQEKSVAAETQEASISARDEGLPKVRNQESAAESLESGSPGDVEASSEEAAARHIANASREENAEKAETAETAEKVENVGQAESAENSGQAESAENAGQVETAGSAEISGRAESAERSARSAGLGDVYAVAEGGVMDRLRTLCLAPAVAATLARRLHRNREDSAAAVAAGSGMGGTSGTRVTVIWDNNADNGFNSLFSGPPRVGSLPGVPSEVLADVAVEETLDESLKGRLTAEIEVAVSECKENESSEINTTSTSSDNAAVGIAAATYALGTPEN
ncbi:unnamed protein product [Closterium sp. Yama58-4]|nr:unnamed protein product [Closterium sp. Yama58-4]